MTLMSVDPEDLRAAAVEISDSAAILERGAREAGDDISLTHHPRWTTDAELAAAGRVWTDYLRGLCCSVEDTASRLRLAAETYVACERQAAALQRRGDGGRFFE
jgi:hypothetical protein